MSQGDTPPTLHLLCAFGASTLAPSSLDLAPEWNFWIRPYPALDIASLQESLELIIQRCCARSISSDMHAAPHQSVLDPLMRTSCCRFNKHTVSHPNGSVVCVFVQISDLVSRRFLELSLAYITASYYQLPTASRCSCSAMKFSLIWIPETDGDLHALRGVHSPQEPWSRYCADAIIV
jgi:hypothetical protein